MENEKVEMKEPFQEEPKPEAGKTYVYSIKDWKEYLGESFLIVFSVLLALYLSEYINKVHDRQNTRNILKSITAELNHNKIAIQEMQAYNLKVLERIDSALVNKKIQNALISNDEFHLDVIAPDGVLFRYLEQDAWAIAKNNNIMSKLNIESISILTRIYEDQGRIGKVEDEVARVIFDRASRDPKQVHSTLILIRDIYHGWAADRVPGLISRIDTAVKQIETGKSIKQFKP